MTAKPAEITRTRRGLCKGQKQQLFWAGFILLLIVSLARALQTPSGVIKKYPLGSQGELQLTLQKEWRDTMMTSPRNVSPAIQIVPETGDSFKILLTVIGGASPKMAGKYLESSVEQMSGPAALQSLEKKADIKQFKGEQTEGYYYSLTDSAPAPGEFTFMTQGLTRVGELLLSFTILSNDRTQQTRDAALNLIKTAVHVKAAGEEVEIAIPGQGWKIHVLNPGFGQLDQQSDSDHFVCRSRGGQGFNLSLFVEKPGGRGSQHMDVFNHYWPLANQNPLIKQESIKVEKKEKFVKVSYLTGPMPNVNYYFINKGRWVDVHISKLPFGKEDEPLFAAFEKALSYRD